MIDNKKIVDNIPILNSFYKDDAIPAKPTIIIDTQEKIRGAYSFNDNLFNVVNSKLETGDYSLLGLNSSILTVERKSFPDYVKTVIHDWERFSNQLKRMTKFRYKMIIVERALHYIKTETYKDNYKDENLYQTLSCNQLIGKALYIEQQYNIPVHFLESRQESIWFMEKYFFQIWERYKKGGMAGLRMVK